MLSINKIYLASKSPRRRELLRQVDIKFELLLLRDVSPRGPDVTEQVLENESPINYVSRVTKEKAQAAWNAIEQRHLPLNPVLAADTTVVINEKILGKPNNREEAVVMMKLLSGNIHSVHTSIALQYHHHFLQFTQTSEVNFC
jgi:septum formation protein